MDSSPVVEALTRALRDHGRLLAEHPERVRALLSDVLGAQARALRAEIDLVVVASEEDVPRQLLASGGARSEATIDEAVRTLEARGLTTTAATFATIAWASALGVQLSDSLAAEADPISMGQTSTRPTSPGPTSTGVTSTGQTSTGATFPGQGPSGNSATGEAASSGWVAATDPALPRGSSSGTSQGSGGVLHPADVTDLAGSASPAAGKRADDADSPSPKSVTPSSARNWTSRAHLTARGARTGLVAAGVVAALVGGVLGLQALWPNDSGADTGTAEAVVRRDATLRLLSTETLAWDPLATTDAGLRLFMNRALYRGLVAFAPTEGDRPSTLVPDLATSTGDTNDGGRTWAFTLTDGPLWENGDPVTCADAKVGLERAFAGAKFFGYAYEAAVLVDVPKNAEGLPTFAGGTAGRAEFDKAVTCQGKTLTIRLRTPNLDFPRYAALPELAPFKAASPQFLGTRSLANGPYQLDVTTSTATVGRLVRNARWSASNDRLRQASPHRIEVTGSLEANVVTERLQADAGDDKDAASLSPLPVAAAIGFKDSPDRTQVAPSGLDEVLVVNLSSPAMAKPAVREAVSWSTDREAYVASYGGSAVRVPLYSLAGPHRNSADRKGDPAVAKTRLEQAGQDVTLRVAYRSEAGTDIAMAALAHSWEAAGFTVTLKPFKGTVGEYYLHLQDTMRKNVYDLVRMNAVQSLDPLVNVSSYDSRTNGVWLSAGFKDLAVNAAIDVARTSTDAAQRAKAWDKVHSLATNGVVVVPVASRVSLFGHGSQVRGARTLIEFSGALDTISISLTTS